MRKRKILGESLVVEKYLRQKDDDDDMVGNFIGELVKQFKESGDSEKKLDIILQIILFLTLQYYKGY